MQWETFKHATSIPTCFVPQNISLSLLSTEKYAGVDDIIMNERATKKATFWLTCKYLGKWTASVFYAFKRASESFAVKNIVETHDDRLVA